MYVGCRVPHVPRPGCTGTSSMHDTIHVVVHVPPVAHVRTSLSHVTCQMGTAEATHLILEMTVDMTKNW